MRNIAFIAAFACLLVGCGQQAAYEEAPAGSEVVEAGEELVFCEEIERRVAAADCAYFTELANRAEAGVAAFNAPGHMTRGESVTISLAIGYPPPPPPPEPAATVEETPADEVVAEETPAAAEQEPAPAADDVVPGGDQEQTRTTEAEPPPPPPPPLTPAEAVEDLPGETVEYTPLIGRFMRAELSHDGGFEVTQMSPASQEVIPGDVTIWTWRVRAREDGVRRLELKTVVEGCSDEARTTCYPLVTTRQVYDVNITIGWLGRVQDTLTALPDWIKLVTAVVVALTALIGAVFGMRNAFRSGRSSGGGSGGAGDASGT